MDANHLVKGSYNVICDQCGQKYKREFCKVQWDNLFTCFHCYDKKHPWLEPLPIPVDALPVSIARPRPNPLYLDNGLQDMGVWGGPYKTETGYENDITWSGWTGFWGGDNSLPFSADNFPLQ